MEIALGGLGWSPNTFWDSTLPELFAAMDGWRKIHGEPEDDFMGRDEFEGMMKRFPDDS